MVYVQRNAAGEIKRVWTLDHLTMCWGVMSKKSLWAHKAKAGDVGTFTTNTGATMTLTAQEA